MTKKILGTAAAVVLMGSLTAQAQINLNWFNDDSGATQIMDNTGTTPIPTGFLQLISMGANNTVEAPDLSQPDGISASSDDVVLATGNFLGSFSAPGEFSSLVLGSPTLPSSMAGQTLYIRAWETAVSATGSPSDTIPGFGAGPEFYGDSATSSADNGTGAYTLVGSPTEDFDLSSLGQNVTWNTSSTAPAVPEPATATLFGLGLLGMALKRRRKNA